MPSKFLYLALDVFSLAIPFAYSFDKRIKFAKTWKPLFISLTSVAAVFLVWDVIFTDLKIWGFNPKYLTGVELINLPIEEWLFFWFIPYSCIFIYASMNYFIRRDIFGKIAAPFSISLSLVILVIGLFNLEKLYTSITFIGTSIFLVLTVYVLKPKWLGRFYIGYFISLIPFFIVNGLLTGSFIDEQVVWYNNDHNLGIRMGTIPIEDSIYLLLLLLMNVSIYERLKNSSIINVKT